MAIQRDPFAARVIRDLRENKGLSPEQLSHELHLAGLDRVSGQTIRRIERDPYPIPQVRTRFALAAFFDRNVIDIWRPRRSAPRERVPA